MKNIESKNKSEAIEQEGRIEPEEQPANSRTQASPLKLGDDKQVSRDFAKLYEQDLKKF